MLRWHHRLIFGLLAICCGRPCLEHAVWLASTHCTCVVGIAAEYKDGDSACCIDGAPARFVPAGGGAAPSAERRLHCGALRPPAVQSNYLNDKVEAVMARGVLRPGAGTQVR